METANGNAFDPKMNENLISQKSHPAFSNTRVTIGLPNPTPLTDSTQSHPPTIPSTHRSIRLRTPGRTNLCPRVFGAKEDDDLESDRTDYDAPKGSEAVPRASKNAAFGL